MPHNHPSRPEPLRGAHKPARRSCFRVESAGIGLLIHGVERYALRRLVDAHQGAVGNAPPQLLSAFRQSV
jgi:hypothetical protein